MSGLFNMFISILDKELEQFSVLQEVWDQRITQSKAAHIGTSDLMLNSTIQCPSACYLSLYQSNNSKLSEELGLRCLTLIAELDYIKEIIV